MPQFCQVLLTFFDFSACPLRRALLRLTKRDFAFVAFWAVRRLFEDASANLAASPVFVAVLAGPKVLLPLAFAACPGEAATKPAATIAAASS